MMEHGGFYQDFNAAFMGENDENHGDFTFRKKMMGILDGNNSMSCVYRHRPRPCRHIFTSHDDGNGKLLIPPKSEHGEDWGMMQRAFGFTHRFSPQILGWFLVMVDDFMENPT